MNGVDMPPWKHRRRLIYGTCILSAGMIIFAAATFKSDTNVAGQLIIGGVSLLSIVITAYTGFATWEDSRLWRSSLENPQRIQNEATSGETAEETLYQQNS